MNIFRSMSRRRFIKTAGLFAAAATTGSPLLFADETVKTKIKFDDDETSITFIGHASTLIRFSGKTFLTDPVFSNWVVILKRHSPVGVTLDLLPEIDCILLSHGHFDHLDIGSLELLPKNIPVITPPGLGGIIGNLGFADVRERALEESTSLGEVKITPLFVQHFPGRDLFYPNTKYCGFMLEGDERSVFFAGDTGLTDAFKLYGEKYSIDSAVLPIGAYSPFPIRRHHMSPDDALVAMRYLKAKTMIPIHYGAFRLSLEPMDEPPRLLAELALSYGVTEQVKIIKPGEKTFI
jgi:L-ascorbate metabolism protein UlaG (beta-lactamase superfamily)